jgi:hypothetical protein
MEKYKANEDEVDLYVTKAYSILPTFIKCFGKLCIPVGKTPSSMYSSPYALNAYST